MTQTSLDHYGADIIEHVWGDGMQHMEYCEICGRLAVGRPCIYNGHAIILDWECIYRIREGLPMLEPEASA